MFRHMLLPMVYFPALFLTVLLGGDWPVVYAIASVISYLVLDRYTLRSVPIGSKMLTWINNCWLLMQIPLSTLLLLLLFVGVAPGSIGTTFFQSHFGLQLVGFHGATEALAASIVVGFHLSTNFVVAHELMHRQTKFYKASSRVLLMMVGDAHFLEAHIYGHHANVGTHSDPATARRGESFYRFLCRSTIGQWREAYAHECHRLGNGHWLKQITANRVVRGNLGSVLLLVGVAIVFGYIAMFCYLVVALIAKSLLEAINYIQHYGLVREKNVRSNSSHSWECDGLGSSLILFNLTRHAQHHQRPRITCDRLEYSSQSPQIKGGYMLAILTCFIPPLWFRSMHPILDQGNQVSGPSSP